TGGYISFAVSTDCLSMDKLTFTIDGVEKEQWSGDAEPWENFSLPLLAGTYTFKWEFNKISNGTFYSDAAFLDDIKITTNASPTLQIKDGNNYAGKLLTSDANGVATWKGIEIDTDWIFPIGNSDADQIYHQGNIKIGDDDATIFNLHVEGSKNVGIGSIEYLDEGFTTLHISNSFAPITDNSIDLGTSTNRWKDVWSTNGVINTSDKRLKTNIAPLEYGLDEILKLRTVSFKWKEEKVDNFVIPEDEKENKLGLIAQEVLKIIPEVIQTHQWKEYEENPGVLVKEEMRRIGISYSEIIPVITKAIQEQEKEIRALEQQNNRLKSMFNKLKNK
ncbi:MAG: tail fiber domain-containing protein, partial [Flavobacteriaceae bacterium]|nr:tail fiber domain-containing protein [Flavobacteriaceae bacterium]